MFELKNFSNKVLNPSKAPNEFQYITDDTMAVVLGAGYFNSLFDVLKVNDLILVTAEANATPVTSYIKVSANANKVVTVVDGVDLV